MIHYSFMITEPLSAFENDQHAVFSFIKECGYEGVEFNLTPELIDKQDQLEQSIVANELVIPAFMTGEAYCRGFCLSSPEPVVRQRTVGLLIDYLEVARRFNAILIVGLLQGLRSDEPASELANQRIVEGLREVGIAAEKRGVEFVVEPVNHLQVGFNNSVAEVLQLIQAVGSSALKPMVDTIHMNIEDISLTQPIDDCIGALRHVHLCESNGGVFGSGHIDFGSVLGALDRIGYEGFASVKVYRKATLKEAAISSIEHLRQHEPGK